MSDLSEMKAQWVIMRDRYRRSFCLPNYSPSRWWECDVFEVTAAGYFREYEVKMTISDFKADARKMEPKVLYDDNGRFLELGCGRTKHEQLAAGSEFGPVEFWFVMPPGLVALEPQPQLDPLAVLPDWAGLIEIEERHGHLHEWRVKQAPRLHREKLRDAVVAHAHTIPYWRMHSMVYDRASAS